MSSSSIGLLHHSPIIGKCPPPFKNAPEGVAEALGDDGAGGGGAHVGEEEVALDLLRQLHEVLVVPRLRHARV